MGIPEIKHKTMEFIKKYKYVTIILTIGLLFMLIPSGYKETEVSKSNSESQQEEMQIDEKLEEILSQISGAGEVRVLLTVATGEELVYQTDNKLSQSEENSSTQIDTVTITDSDRNENGLIKQTISPVYRGAIIVCQGADNATVRLAIVEAVAKVTGLSSDRISVLKMK